METFDAVAGSPQPSEEMLRQLLAIDLDVHFELLVQAFHNEVRTIVRQLTNATQLEQIARADTIAADIFAQMYSNLKNLKADQILKLALWARLYRITIDRCLGLLVKRYETQIYKAVQQLVGKNKLEQSKAVLALAEIIFTEARQELKNCDTQAIRTPEFWIWLHNLIIAHFFGQLIQTYRRQLETFVLRLGGHADNTQDIVQDALLNAFKALKEHGVPDKKDTFDPQSWIFQIARNEFLKSLRKFSAEGKETSISYAAEDHPVFEIVDDRNIPPDVALELAESLKNMEELVNKLPEPYREIIRLRFFDGRSNTEIADQLKMKEVTLRTYVHRGLKLLRKLMIQGSIES